MRTVVRVVALVALWVLAWGDASPANLISGTVLAVALVLAFPPARISHARLRVRPVAMLRLGAYMLGQLLVSSMLVARAVVSRHTRVRTGVLAHHVADDSDEALTVLVHLIALTPGTMADARTADAETLYVHFLLLDDIAGARRSLTRLERLMLAALGRRNPPDTAPAGSGGRT